MSINLLNQNNKKTWLNARINNLYLDGTFNIGNTEYINTLSDLPEPINNIIYLEPYKTYYISSLTLDLEGNRLETKGICNIFGFSSETSYLTSTGLDTNTALITSNYTLILEQFTIKDVGTAIYIDGNSNTVALDWKALNFLNVDNVGTINTCDNFIYDTSAFLSANGLKFTGTIGTISINNSLLSGNGLVGSIIELDANCIITRRFRIIYSSVIAFGATEGLNVNNLATIPNESFILETINFSGGSVYLSDLDDTSNKSLFRNCIGIINTSVNGQLYMQNNAIPTPIPVISNFYKIEGITIPSANNSKFSHTDNRLTCQANISRKYLLQATLSFNSGNNNVCEFGFYNSQTSDVIVSSITKSTSNSAGRAENISFNSVISMINNDFVEIHCSNTTGTNDITVDSLNFIITEIN